MADTKHSRQHFFSGILSAVILGGTTVLFAACALLGGSGNLEYPLWQPLLRVHDHLVLAFGNNRIGSVYAADDRLLPCLSEPDDSAVQAAAIAVNAYAETANTSVYLLAVPTSAGVYGDMLPEALPLVNEHQILRHFADALSDQVKWIEAASWLSPEREQYIYYRTDSCWTAYGAFCVYRSAIRKLGFSAVGYDQFRVKHFCSDYYGALAQRSHFYDVTPDTVDLYTIYEEQLPDAVVTALHPDGKTVLPSYFRTDLPDAAEHPERVYALESEPVLRIDTQNGGSSDLLLLTDHYGSSMIPFLMQHYRSVTAVNLTLAADMDWRALTAGNYSQILILCGTDTMIASDGLSHQLAVEQKTESERNFN